ncbi:MAG: hypothetical protein GWP75_09135, partial [Planctomycetia bacterium]|nr:hypothetical protein [Planctomycetia bacterium]
MTTKKTSTKSKKKKSSGRRGSATTNVVVLGGGLIGSVIASDLAASRGMRVTVADANADSLKNCVRRADRSIETVETDLADAGEIAKVIENADLVVGALPSGLGPHRVGRGVVGAQARVHRRTALSRCAPCRWRLQAVRQG